MDWGDAANQLYRPYGIALDASGNLYIADTENHRIQKWAPGASEGETVAGGNADGSAAMNNLLGGKGANLAEMTNLGIPVPPGFTISTEVCTYYMKISFWPFFM